MRVIFLLALLMVGCGSEREIEPKQAPEAQAPVILAPATFAEIKPLLDTFCLDCHKSDRFLVSEAQWKASAGPARVKNKSMPQAGSDQAKKMSDADRAKILSLK